MKNTTLNAYETDIVLNKVRKVGRLKLHIEKI